jgi:hypothetical protein
VGPPVIDVDVDAESRPTSPLPQEAPATEEKPESNVASGIEPVPVAAESPDVREPVKEVTPVCDDVPETAIPVRREDPAPPSTDMPPPPVPSSSQIPAVNLLPPTPNTSQEAENAGQTTLLQVPETTTPVGPDPPTSSRSRSRSPAPDPSPRRRSPRLASPAPSTKRPASDALDDSEPAPKKAREE